MKPPANQKTDGDFSGGSLPTRNTLSTTRKTIVIAATELMIDSTIVRALISMQPTPAKKNGDAYPGLSSRSGLEHQDPRSWQTPWATRIGFWSVQGQENDIVRAGYLMDGLTADVAIVEETYDQMDCTMRSLIRQQKPSSHPQNLDEALTATASSSTRNATRRTQQLNLS